MYSVHPEELQETQKLPYKDILLISNITNHCKPPRMQHNTKFKFFQSPRNIFRMLSRYVSRDIYVHSPLELID